MYTINFPAIAPSAAHNFSVKTIEFKMAAVSVKRSIRTRGHAVNHVREILNIFVLLDKFFCLVLNENLLLLNSLSCFFHLVSFISEF